MGGPPNQALVLAAMVFAVSMTFIDQAVVPIAAPDFIRELGLTSSRMQWVFYPMTGALVVAFICALWHPGTRVAGDAGGAARPEGSAPHP
ncbi:hypothetical protein P8A22_37205 [Streptomyces laculatispora]|uniref:Uncharacterized protein n=1 Tax=Streptomyces laculatispora TaxID=887464 RepID=A0ABY9IF60_9ACTN|nr:hypothetical protein [Streptomyces laculatispora]WLQ45590.1 hypothetical protein P8A22_37205 [Streptomyces laculatispora]